MLSKTARTASERFGKSGGTSARAIASIGFALLDKSSKKRLKTFHIPKKLLSWVLVVGNE